MIDSRYFESNIAPEKLIKYENEIRVDPQSGLNDYLIRVWFETKSNEKYLYSFTIAHGAMSGSYKIEKAEEQK